jgi:hypothetical protein
LVGIVASAPREHEQLAQIGNHVPPNIQADLESAMECLRVLDNGDPPALAQLTPANTG